MRTSTFIKGVAKSIHSVFGNDCIIYINGVEQGLGKECFLITAVRSDFERRIKGRYVTSTSIDLSYFPEDGRDYDSMHEVIPDCVKALALIDCDGVKIRGESISSNIVDGVLHLYAEYSIGLADDDSGGDKMQSLKQNIGEKQ